MVDSTKPGVFPERRNELNRFISSLSPWELLYMRQKMQQTTIKLAGLEDMPPELICLLEPHLELRDVLSCQLVSKAWSGAWSQDGVAYQVCNRYFPGLMEMHPFEAFGRLLVDALNKRRREHSSKRLIRWNTNWETPIFQNPSRRPRSIPLDTGSEHSQQYPIRYVDGKMAWQPRRDLVIVDDLNTKIRQRVVCPRLEPPLRYQLVALSSQLVVFFTIDQEHETHVVPVYHLEHRQFKKIHLPSPVAQCCVDGDRVGAVTKTGQIIVWTWNGKSTQLDLEGVSTPPDSSPHLVPGLFFHPRDGTVFAVWFYGPALLYSCARQVQRCSHCVAIFNVHRKPYGGLRTYPQLLQRLRLDIIQASKSGQ
ncbi:hypothetical protein B0T10DRAFT_176767 [Thelonectria olida]|uniref:F-box domain-containing protein n=1 Tax=Thelonectria olida TaxID=1576542 RepID=A0A9P8WER9_9HYPO|nr:hypothetical protein B0T10DRAFT_176767 [Thelonectria olida]